uniref:GRF-type domain-containing protein n=1 Tax=Oryza nivara TaxID=4536 RepID=A0A0E0J0D4_ORYNI
MASSQSDGSSSYSQHSSRSPIPYRVGPFDYQSAVMCDCHVKAARWISWSPDNPSRRYFKCRNAREGGCGFYAWYDGPTTTFIREVLVSEEGEGKTCLAIQEERMKVEEKIIERELEAARKLSCDYAERIAVLKDRNSRLAKERCYLLVVVMGCVFVMFALVLVRRNVG